MSITNFEQKDTTSDEWAFNLWSDSRDWCSQCDQKNNKLVFDDQTKTVKCTKCGHAQTFEDNDWKILQAQRHIIYQYMPEKYVFSNLSFEEIFAKYLREYNHIDWASFVIHDYVLARMRDDKSVQDKLLETTQLIVEKMSYDPKPWKNFFEKLDAPDPEIFLQIPQTIYEFVEKKLKETLPKEDFSSTLDGYVVTLTTMYCYSRWKGDKVTCWIITEIIKFCDIDNESLKFYSEFFSCEPLLESFQEDLIAGKKREINLKDSYIQWELNLADMYLQQTSALVAVRAAYSALTAKLGLHALWPPTKALPFDINAVKKVCEIVNDPELFRFYDLATDLNSIDVPKACYYAKHFIEHVKKMLPNVSSIEQEMEKRSGYIT
ncbi:MAG: hypothetical protein LBH62_05005 [Nitrososphaerota archaeon]|jgi:Zn ribbon nucleic-acid-binding protein|nr:hypothetical protein [Nitrososphaerota archaeon]